MTATAGPPGRTVRVLVVTAVPAERDAVLRGAGTANTTNGGEPSSVRVRLPGGGELHRITVTDGGTHQSTGANRDGAANQDDPDGTPVPDGTPLVLDVLAAGVGPGTAAAGSGTALATATLGGSPYDLVVSAGIGGGFRESPLGTPAESARTTAPRIAGSPATVVVADTIIAADLGAETAEGFTPVTELGFGRSTYEPPSALVRAVVRATGGTPGPVLTVSTTTGSAARATELARRHPGAVAEAMEGFGVAEAATQHGVPALELRTVSNPVGPRDRAAWRIREALDALAEAFANTAPILGSRITDGWRTHG